MVNENFEFLSVWHSHVRKAGSHVTFRRVIGHPYSEFVSLPLLHVCTLGLYNETLKSNTRTVDLFHSSWLCIGGGGGGGGGMSWHTPLSIQCHSHTITCVHTRTHNKCSKCSS